MGDSTQLDFISTPAGTLDRKGRVCIPANYRQILAAQGTSGVYVRPHPDFEILQCFGQTLFDTYKRSQPPRNPFAHNDGEESFEIFSETDFLPCDETGRVRLPDRLIAYAKLGENISFVGKGDLFEIWNSAQLEEYREKKRARARPPGVS